MTLFRSQSRARSEHRLPRWLLVLYACCIVGFGMIGILTGVFLGYASNLPNIQKLEDYRPDVITDIYSDDDKVIGEFAIERRIIVPYDDIPPSLQNALLAAEDDQFFHHSGINLFAILRAVYRDLITMSKAEGASTITQQLARMLLLTPEKQFDRKIKEILLARQIERRYSKQQILTLYCNQHYMGDGAYGFAAAADAYFGKKLQDLSLAQSALLAGLPRNPSLYSPRLRPKSALSRRNYILERMVSEGMISERASKAAKSEPLVLKLRSPSVSPAPYFMEWVRQSLTDRYSTDDIWRKGLRVHTTLNRDMQAMAVRALRDGLRAYDKRYGWRGPIRNLAENKEDLSKYSHPEWRLPPRSGDHTVGLVMKLQASNEAIVRIGDYRAILTPNDMQWTKRRSPAEILEVGDLATFKVISVDSAKKTAKLALDQIPQVQGALISLENATGEIKTMVGGYDFRTSEFNRATQARRQIGSTVKAFVYTAAMESGLTQEDTILDDPISYTDGLGRSWTPRNYDGAFKGEITVREAFVSSRNIPAIKVASLVGIKNVIVMARRFGLSGPMQPYLPLAVGACEATPLEMASAFSVFPNLGELPKPYFIRRIDDYDGLTREEVFPSTQKVLDPETAAQMLGLLIAVVDEGTGKAAKSLNRQVGGKTGTTNDYTDAWFVGFTPSLTTAVWVGFEMKKSLGDKEVGSSVALPIWTRYMAEILEGQAVEKFPVTETIDDIVITEGTDSDSTRRKKLFVEDLPPLPTSNREP